MVILDPEMEGGKKNTPQTAVTFVMIAVIFGIMSIVLAILKIGIGGVVFGGMGLVFGGFTFGRAFSVGGSTGKVLTALVGASLLLSVIGFMLGFASLLE